MLLRRGPACRQAGFTLLEVLVTLTIVTVVTYLVTSAFPVVRDEETLTHASQQLISTLRAAQTQALDEQRSPDCLTHVGEGPRLAKLCSDVGVLIRGGELLTFADTNDNNQFDERDFPLHTNSLPAPVVVTSPVSLVIEATPPNVSLYVNGLGIQPAGTATVTLHSRGRTKSVTVTAYGVVEP